MKVLIVEDTQELATNLVRYLAIKGIQADISPDGVDGLFKAATKYYDAIILDINLPGKDGISVCRELRQKEKDVPIIMLTSRSGKEDIITGLDAGADDYLAKPFDYDILIARIEALTRRNLKNKSTEILRAGPYLIDIEKAEVRKIAASSPLTRGELGGVIAIERELGGVIGMEGELGGNGEVSEIGDEIHLSHLEFELLKYFAQNKGKIIDRKELYEKVWGEFEGDFMFSKTVDVYIGYLRKKLGHDLIETKKGFGYILQTHE